MSNRRSRPFLPHLTVLLASTLAADLPGQQWSAPAAVGHNEVRAVQRHRDGTVHVISHSGWGFQATQLAHSWRPPGGAFAPEAVLTLLNDPVNGAELPIFEHQQFFQLDGDGRAHVVFSKFTAGARRLWYTTFDPQQPGNGWSTPVAVTPVGNVPTGAAMRFDAQRDLHLLWTQAAALGAPQLFHARLPAAGGPWSAPTLLSTPGNPQQGAAPCRHPASPFVVEAGGGLHVFFEQVGPSGVAEVYHRRLPLGGGGWSLPVQVSGQGQPAEAVAAEVDLAGGVHVFWRAIPGLGAPQLWHARCRPGGSVFGATTLLSTPGSPNLGATVSWGRDFVLADAGGDLHVMFEQVPGLGAMRVFERVYDLGNGTWSAPLAATPAGSIHQFEGMLVDAQDRVHVVTRSAQLYHAMRSGGGFTPPTLLSTPGAPNFGADLPWNRDTTPLHLAPDGSVHVLFEQVPGGLGAARIFHRRLDAGANAWTAPVDVSGALSSAARVYETHCDARSELHVVFGAVETQNAREQLFHARTRRDGSWTPPVIVSTPGNPTYQARTPRVAWQVWWLDRPVASVDYDFLGDNGAGSVDLVFDQQAAFNGPRQVYHADLDRFVLAVTTTGLGVGDLQARIANVPAGTTSGYVFLSMSAGGAPGSGPFFGIVPDALTVGVLGMPAVPGNPVHWTWPVQAPLFPAAPFALPPGIMPAGAFIDFVAVAAGPNGWTPSNVQRVLF